MPRVVGNSSTRSVLVEWGDQSIGRRFRIVCDVAGDHRHMRDHLLNDKARADQQACLDAGDLGATVYWLERLEVEGWKDYQGEGASMEARGTEYRVVMEMGLVQTIVRLARL